MLGVVCRSQKAQAAKAPSNEPKAITILYASQTGTAEDIAMSIHADCDEKGIKAKVCGSLAWLN